MMCPFIRGHVNVCFSLFVTSAKIDSAYLDSLIYCGLENILSSLLFITWNIFVKRCFPTFMIWLSSGNIHIEKGKQIFEFFPLFTNFQDNKIASYHLLVILFFNIVNSWIQTYFIEFNPFSL